MSKSNYIKIEGELMFPCIDEVNEMSGKYQINVANLSTADRKKLEEVGLKPKHGKDKVNASGEPAPKPEWGWYIVAKTGSRPRVTNGDLTEMTDEERSRLGKGSKVCAVVNAYEYNHKQSGNSGIACGLNIVQVTELNLRDDAASLLEPVASE